MKLKRKTLIQTRLNILIQSELGKSMFSFALKKHKKCITLLVDIDDGGGYACVGAGGMWEISVASQFCCDLKTALKSILEKKENKKLTELLFTIVTGNKDMLKKNNHIEEFDSIKYLVVSILSYQECPCL